MMRIIIETPTIAYLYDHTDEEIASLRKQFGFIRESVKFVLKKHKSNRWFRTKNPVEWEERLKELESQVHDSVLQVASDGRYFIRPGSIPYIKDIQYTVDNEIKYPRLKPIPWAKELEFHPYYYQKNSLEELLNIRHGNVELATGLGKTLILLMLCRQAGLDTVVVTPSTSIFNELLIFFRKHLGDKYVGGYGDGKKDTKKKITIAINKSLTMLKPESEAWNFFQKKQMLLVDETHSWGSDLLEEVCHKVLSEVPYRFFVSATVTRGDGTLKLLQSIVGQTVYSMGLQEGIEGGFLCPLKFNILKTFSPSNRQISDPIECKRTHFLRNKEIAKLVAKIVNASWNLKQESTLVLVEELVQIEMLLPLITVPFSYAHSASKKEAEEHGLTTVDSAEEVEKFNLSEIKCLVGTSCISTGTNLFPTHNVVNWVGGSSEIKTKQGSIGRSTRKLEISRYAKVHKPKPFSRIFDFDVEGQDTLHYHLEQRIKYYEETGEIVTIPE